MYDPRDYQNLLSYHNRLNIFILKSLEGRREVLSVYFIFDIIKKNTDIKHLNDRVLPKIIFNKLGTVIIWKNFSIVENTEKNNN